MKILNHILLLFLFSFTLFSCDDDEGTGMTEQELITTVELTLFDGVNTLNFTFSDTDGPGGNPPVVDNISLAANTSYNLGIEFRDESDPADVEDITMEVAEEDVEHLVCYTTSGIPAPANFDLDANGDPLGLIGTLTTGDAATGTLQISLKHEPDKAAADPCATGETDVEVLFDVVVQ